MKHFTKQFCQRRVGAQVFLTVIVSLAGSFVSSSAQAARSLGTEHVSISSYYTNYSKLNFGSDTTSKALKPSLDLEIAVRVQTLFSLMIAYSRFLENDTNNDPQTYGRLQTLGAGMKIDLPGFFFFGAEKRDSTREAKDRPFNTFVFAQIMKFDQTEPVTNNHVQGTAPVYGIGLDAFPMTENFYLSARYTFLNILTETYQGVSAGFGLTF